MEELANNADKQIVMNYETEYQKVDNVIQILTKMLNEYKGSLQQKLTESMVKERNHINEHIK